MDRMPQWNTRMVGRERDLASLSDLLARRRLVTLTGAGGCGKTRLAVAAGRAEAARRSEIVFVDLAVVASADGVDDAVRSSMEIPEVPGGAAADAVVAHVGEREALILLDNCEHVVEAAAELVDRLWRACPKLTILATSRVALGVEGEAAFRVPSLMLPADAADETAASVQLFVDRAQLARAPDGFAPEELSAVPAICTHLDGIPLAIELTAARCRSLTPTQILAGIVARLDPTPSGVRSVRPRHRTLHASIDWSYRQLSEQSQRVLRSLCVFASAFTLPAAVAVAAADDSGEDELAATVVALADCSLLELVAGSPSPRFRLLQTVRQYLAAELAARGEENAVRARHAEWFVSRVQILGADLVRDRAGQATAELGEHVADLRLADDWLVGSGQDAQAVALHAPLRLFWSRRYAAEGYARVHRALRTGAGDDETRARALLTFVEAAFFAGRIDEQLMAHRDELLAIVERLGFGQVSGEILSAVGVLEFCLLDERGSGHVDQALPMLIDTPVSFWKIDCMWNLGLVSMYDGDIEGATRWFYESIAEADTLRHPQARAMGPALGGLLSVLNGSYERARHELTLARERLIELGDHALRYCAEAALAWLRAVQGEPRPALEELFAVGQAAARHGQGWALGWVLWARSAIEEDLTPLGQPLPSLDEAEEVMHAEGGMGLWGAVWCRAVRAERLALAGDLVGANAALAVGADESTLPAATLSAHRRRLAAARIALASGDRAAAEGLAHETLRQAWVAHMRADTVTALELVARLAVDDDRAVEATRLLAAAAAARESERWVAVGRTAAGIAECTGRAREQLGASDFAEAWAQGATLDLEQAVSYAGRGRGGRKRPHVGWGSLTPAELGVATLAARGLRNADIATTLFTSTATVKTHLTRVFRKLGVTSRAELAALMAARTTDQSKV